MTDEKEIESPPTKRQKFDAPSTIVLPPAAENVEDFTEDNLGVTDKFTIGDKYDNFVTPEEVQRLREFRVLDEVKDNEEDSNEGDSDDSEGKSEELPEEEIEKMLDEDLPPAMKQVRKPKEKPYVTRSKIVLEEKGVNQFEILPLDWMMVKHYSGMPVYMHRPTRVCTLSKPYFLGKGNTRKHDIPISAIPCLAYRRALEEEEKQMEIDRRVEEHIKNKTMLKAMSYDTNQNNDSGSNNDNNPDQAKETGNTSNDLNGNNNDNPKRGKCPFSHLRKDVGGENKVDESILRDNPNNNAPVEAIHELIKQEVSDHLEVKDQEISNDEEQIIDNDKANNNETANYDVETPDDNDQDTIDGIPLSRQPVVLPGGIMMPSPRVESVNSSWKTQHLTAEQINDYCKSLFKFRMVQFMHFNRWADRRKYTKARKALQHPKLPEGTKLITIPAPKNGQENGKSVKRDWVMNMNGCSYLSEFHEYVRRALNKRPVYEYKQLENASTPYQATVFIGGMQYGIGHGSSKRQAKYAAVKASVEILIPAMRDHVDALPSSTEPDFSFFDQVGIEDPRIAEFCASTCEPSPHAILLTCLLRNFGAGDWNVHTEMKKLEYQKIELTMRVGKHSATVVCKNKKTAKQRASQAILQQLHPHVTSWGSLLRLYGSRSVKSCKEKKLEEQQITLLQDKARHNQPNHAVLDKLRHEMLKLRERDAAVVPIGTLVMLDDLPTHSGSNLNNVDL